MAGVSATSTSPVITQTQTATPAPAPAATPATSFTNTTGYTSNSSFTSNQLSSARVSISGAMNAINRPLPNLPADVVAGLRQQGMNEINAAINAQPPLDLTQLFTALNSAMNNFNVALNTAYQKQAADNYRSAVVTAHFNTLNQPNTRLPESQMGPIRNAALSQANTLVNQQPPLTTQQLGLELDKVIRNFFDQTNQKIAFNNTVDAAYKGFGTQDARIPEAWNQYKDQATKQLDAAVSTNPPLPSGQLQVLVNQIMAGFRTNVANAVANKLTVDGALPQIARQPDANLKFTPDQQGTVTALKDVANKVLLKSLTRTPPMTPQETYKLTADTINGLRTNLQNLSKGMMVIVVDPTLGTGEIDMAARASIINQGLAQMSGIKELDVGLGDYDGHDGPTPIATTIGTEEANKILDTYRQKIQSLANQQPMISNEQLASAIGQFANQYKEDLAVQLTIYDMVVFQTLQVMWDIQKQYANAPSIWG